MILKRLYSFKQWDSLEELLNQSSLDTVNNDKKGELSSKRYFEVQYIKQSWYIIFYKKENGDLIDTRFSKEKEELLTQLVELCKNYWFLEEFYTK